MRPPITHKALRPLRQLPRPHLRLSSTHAPPPARPYRPQTDEERAAHRKAIEPAPPAPAPRSRTRQLLSKYLNPFHEPEPATGSAAPGAPEPRDPARGIAAAERVVTQGVLDPRYQAGARRWIAIILGLVVSIGLAPEVWRRTMRGEKRKEIPVPGKRREEDGAITAEGNGDGKKDDGR